MNGSIGEFDTRTDVILNDINAARTARRKEKRQMKKRKRLEEQSVTVPLFSSLPKLFGPRLQDHQDDISSPAEAVEFPQHCTYISSEMKLVDHKRYKAAGALFYRFVGNNMQVLLGKLARKGCHLAILGGKRTRFEAAPATACRELFEETGTLLDIQIINSLVEKFSSVMEEDHAATDSLKESISGNSVATAWVEYGRYILYMCSVDIISNLQMSLEGLSDQFDEFIRRGVDLLPKHVREMSQLQWIDIDEIIGISEGAHIDRLKAGRNYSEASSIDSVIVETSYNSQNSSISSVLNPLPDGMLSSASKPTEQLMQQTTANESIQFSNFAGYCFRNPLLLNWLQARQNEHRSKFT